jgi:hypothetical protein
MHAQWWYTLGPSAGREGNKVGFPDHCMMMVILAKVNVKYKCNRIDITVM